MIVQRYLVREIVQAMAAVGGVVLLVFMGQNLTRYLGSAASGNIPSDIVFGLLFYLTLSSLGMILPVALYVAILIAFGRLYKENEMTALAACGIGVAAVTRTVAAVGLVFAVIVAALTFLVTPWAAEQAAQLREQAATAAEIETVRSAEFMQSGADKVIFVERLSGDRKSMNNVFVQQQRQDQLVVYTSHSGYQYRDPQSGERYVVLVDGYRYQGQPGSSEYSIQQFEKSALHIVDRPLEQQKRRLEAIPTTILLQSGDPKQQAEFQWRVAMPVSVLLLALLAALLSRSSPRQGRFAKLFAAIMLLVIYNNGLAVARTWIEHGIVPHVVGMWWIHGLLVLIIAAMFARQGGFFRAAVPQPS